VDHSSANPTPSEPARFRPRRPWLAFFLGLLVPGLGHVYAGAPWRAVAALAVLLLAFVPVTTLIMVSLSFSVAGVLASFGISLALGLLIPLDAALTARRRRSEPPGRWNRVWIYVLYAVASGLSVPEILRWELDHAWLRNDRSPR